MNNKLDDLLENPTGYADFDNLSYWQIIFNSAIAIMVFFAWIKVRKWSAFIKIDILLYFS